MMIDYRYVATDLRTGAKLGDLPLEKVQFGPSLNQPGTFNAVLPIDPTGKHSHSPAEIRAWSTARRTLVVCLRDEVPVGHGIIWRRRYASAESRSYRIVGFDLLSWLQNREVWWSDVWQDLDQFQIVYDMLDRMQERPQDSIGLRYGPELSGILRQDTFRADATRTYFSHLAGLGAMANGFDFTTEVIIGGDGNFQRWLRLGHPTLGASSENTGMLLEYIHPSLTEGEAVSAGNVRHYEWPEDGRQTTTNGRAQSLLDDGSYLVGHYEDTAALTGGLPRLDRHENFYGITEPSTLVGKATDMVQSRAGVVVTPKFTVAVTTEDTQPGRWHAGDWARVRIQDPWRFPGSEEEPLELDMRILTGVVEPEPIETVTFTMTGLLEEE